ncbi:nitroreductase family protein [Draconibacterium sp. IB214405]|uniref:nitroreductase family protein n=1 Tax=Draconibacterium sp. IB214405 TaxID=3097352 RepID=UPI002A12589B|nr:nitroreductase family protein [Draconibacterium sp. IB214405]MDX8339519.1 nitroreductase family protein [Draconibacterium sp. IB214405]
MELSDIIRNRYSVRDYKPTKIEKTLILDILEAARMAPSAVNFQPWHFIVIQEEKLLNTLKNCYDRSWFKTAPAVIVACADHSQSWKRASDGKDSADIDLAIAIDHMTLKATELGLGTCWVCNFDVNYCADLLKLPHNIEPVALIPLGYPNGKSPIKKRKPLDEIVHFDQFNQ